MLVCKLKLCLLEFPGKSEGIVTTTWGTMESNLFLVILNGTTRDKKRPPSIKDMAISWFAIIKMTVSIVRPLASQNKEAFGIVIRIPIYYPDRVS